MDIPRAVIAILLGMLVTALMEWLTAAPHGLDVLLGVLVALFYYFGQGRIRS